MKTKRFGLLAFSAFLVLAVLAGGVGAATLKVGDAAPELQVAKWVQGEPVKELQKGTAYLVEFWATWCGPCRTTIPHLTDRTLDPRVRRVHDSHSQVVRGRASVVLI